MSPDLDGAVSRALAGRYAIERELGAGGMATVYLAEDLRHHRRVALKVMRPDVVATLGSDRFLREIGIAARLSHPHILPLFDSGDSQGVLWYTMPYVAGETLRQRLRREGQLEIDEAMRIAREVGSALHHAHAQGIVHRDIKPENILLHEGAAMVADFGIARALSVAAGEHLTATGIAIGTPEYMSPEQATGETDVDARSDVYSLACVLYEMLAGEPPYAGPTPMAVLARTFTDPVPSVRRLRPTVPRSVDDAIRRALARNAVDRFPDTESFARALAADAPVTPRARSVAVLPFLNLSADPENEYFADGITEDVIAHLAKLRAIEVISRSSVMPFRKREQPLREIGARLNVSTLLDGSVRRAGNRVRIVAQLIDAESERGLWAETYDRQLTDIFAIQTDVALQIAGALEAEITHDERNRIRREPTHDLAAYQLYLQGRHWFIRYTPAAMHKAIDYFEAAIARDPEYALACAGIAQALAELAEIGAMPPDEAHPRAKAAVARALELDPELGEAYCTLAYLRFTADFDWSGAETAFQRSLELNPGGADTYDLYGRMLSALGRYEESIAALHRARELDPLAHRLDSATTLLRAGRYDEAVEYMRPVVALDPTYGRARATLGWAYFLKGMHAEGIAELEAAAAVTEGDTAWLAQLGEAYGLAGRTGEARTILHRLESLARERYVSPYHFAYVHTGLGEQERAIDWLEKAYTERAGSVYGMKGSFLLSRLRSHPRFIALLARMNLA